MSAFARHDDVIRAKTMLPSITKRAVYEFLLDVHGGDLPGYGAFTRYCRANGIPFGAAAAHEPHPRFETPPPAGSSSSTGRRTCEWRTPTARCPGSTCSPPRWATRGSQVLLRADPHARRPPGLPARDLQVHRGRSPGVRHGQHIRAGDYVGR